VKSFADGFTGWVVAGYLSKEELRDLLNQMEFMNPSDRHFQQLLEQADLTDRENVDFSDVMMFVLACSMDVRLSSLAVAVLLYACPILLLLYCFTDRRI
jgi:Ca2+-binding EF-hand superfamily protein